MLYACSSAMMVIVPVQLRGKGRGGSVWPSREVVAASGGVAAADARAGLLLRRGREGGTTELVCFTSEAERDAVVALLLQRCPVKNAKDGSATPTAWGATVREVQQKWLSGQISNFAYLMARDSFARQSMLCHRLITE